mgnify:CR=1 FL=1
MEITKITMLRLKGTTEMEKQQLFNEFEGFNGTFEAKLNFIAKSGNIFNVFYLLPNEGDKRALKKHIDKKHCVTQEPVIALHIKEAENIVGIFEKLREKALKMGGVVVKEAHSSKAGMIVLTFDKENVCNRFGMWAMENFNE